MTLLLLCVHHRFHGLSAVERTQAQAPKFLTALEATGRIRGFVEISTCNRWELYLDVEPDSIAECAHTLVRTMVSSGIDLPAPLVHANRSEAVTHLFQVAAGLDSMVLGEREITGQLRRAVAVARETGTLTAQLDIVFTHALRTARQVQSTSGISSTGRSIVSVALDMVSIDETRPVLIVGTGAYAGAAVSALRERGVTHIGVHSASGRGHDFAESHHTYVVDNLQQGITEVATVVCCSGNGTIITPDVVEARSVPLAIVDLALTHDVAATVRDLAYVRVVNLDDVQHAAPSLAEDELAAARKLIADGVTELSGALSGRRIAPAIAALQDLVTTAVDKEVARLPERDLTRDEAAHALRRLAAQLAHVPLAQARHAAKEGHTDAYLSGMATLLGIENISLDDDDWDFDSSHLETARCPVTGLAIDDLAPPARACLSSPLFRRDN